MIWRKKGGEETQSEGQKAGKTSEKERTWETYHAKLQESTVEREGRAEAKRHCQGLRNAMWSR